MRIQKRLTIAACLCLIGTGLLFAQYPGQNRIRVSSGLGVEYLHRSFSAGDDGGDPPSLTSLLLTLRAEFAITDGITVETMAGYSLSGMDKMIFRQLPFSLELETGRIGGFLFGGGLDVFITDFGDFEISGRGGIVFSIGMDKEWELSGLAVPGTAKGSPNWLRLSAGPAITYTGFVNISPYFYVGYEHFSGSFLIEENIQTLSGSEDRDLAGLGKLHLALGALYQLSDRFDLKGEISLIPHSSGADFGITLRTSYGF